jgi:hypothetical protein
MDLLLDTQQRSTIYVSLPGLVYLILVVVLAVIAPVLTSVLCDFFRYAFDGSGADNFFEAGSCIDGRLTSAWNWCQVFSPRPVIGNM